ncbi:Hypothetical predicted protein [Lynx pardinus]|uniref:Uncharacterized protein n=1 Tax=Lynx pardinus TaxID=191816 RepID=A0A485MKH7_LYNPA|nr:Hypothetical predicted protein [Lynx pardinus]
MSQFFLQRISHGNWFGNGHLTRPQPTRYGETLAEVWEMACEWRRTRAIGPGFPPSQPHSSP